MPPIFLSRDGEQFGPYPPDDIQTMLDAGQVLPTDYYWHEGMEEWGVVGENFFGNPSPPQPPPPSPAPTPLQPQRSDSPEPGRGKRRQIAACALVAAAAIALLVAFFIRPGEPAPPTVDPLPAAAATPPSQPTPEATAPPPTSTERQLRIISWNLEWYPGGRMRASPEEAARHEATAKAELLKLNPDIFLAQEIRSWSDFERLASSLSGLHTAVVSAFRIGRQVAQQQVAIASRLTINCAWAEDWKPAYPTPPRGFSAAVLEVPSSDRLLLVYSVHLKSNLTKRPGDEQKNYLQREESVRQILAHVRDMERLFNDRISCVIVGGDFNTNHDGQFGDKTISMMVEAGFHNTWADTPAEVRQTWRGSREYNPTTFDYIFTKGISHLGAQLLRSPASDHMPVEISLPLSELVD